MLSPQEIESATQGQILDKIFCISLYTNALGKSTNLSVLPPNYGRLGSLALVCQALWEKENSELIPALLC